MIARLPTTCPVQLDDRIRRIIAEHAGVAANRVFATNADRHYKSSIVHLTTDGPDGAPRFVLKREDDSNGPGTWDPQREFNGLRLAQSNLEGFDTLGVITPVAYGVSPPFLISEFQPGSSLRPEFDRAIQGLRRNRDLTPVCETAGDIASWLAAFRGGHESNEDGITADQCRIFCGDRLREIAAVRRHSPVLDGLPDVIDGLLAALNDREVRAMGATHPTHGDLSPQNFLRDERGGLVALDFEGFGYQPMNLDFACFRMRMEHYALRGGNARRRATFVWRAFWDRYATLGEGPAFSAIAYLYKSLVHAAWVLNTGRSGRVAPSGKISTKIRTALWIRDRFRWLKGLSSDPQKTIQYLRKSL